MLKAVRFDPELNSHKQLIEFMESYLDKRGKPNHSEAIRLLMEKGYESLHGKSFEVETKVEIQPQIDIEEIKKSLLDEVMKSLAPMLKPQVEEKVLLKQEPVYEKPPQPTQPKPPLPNMGGLMGNLLNNAKR